MQNSTVTYREAHVGDRTAIIDFQVAMALETEGVALDRPTVTRGVEAVFRDPSKGRYYVGVGEDTVVASLLITYEWSDWRDGLVWWIQSVYVLPQFRGKRVYAGLYAHVRELAMADENIKGIRLYVDERNTRAQAVYTRLGMTGEHYRVFEWMK
jgi:ribosomal protein S18 acetylase RimI-like enzyme